VYELSLNEETPNERAEQRRGFGIDDDFELPKHILEENDLLFARSGATVGKTYLYSAEDGLCVYAGYLIKFSLNGELCRPKYVAQWARSPMYWSLVRGAIKQAAQPNINASQYRRFVLPCPKPEEQDRITAVLEVQDRRIYAEERHLSKLKTLKKGLMQELLTRGIPGRHTKFKQTEIGEIPEEWEVVTLDEVARVQTGAAKNKKNERALDVPYLRVANVQDGFVDLRELKTLRVNSTALARYGLRPGYVLFTEGGDADKLGRRRVLVRSGGRFPPRHSADLCRALLRLPWPG
jgi:type I restriction enzyme, S subunit